mmetsp:Transcript_11685/g.25291  ORF Transcript_11685/g.25291 Transcript_11685/m.25291 type:complete len:215 (+) Transcript_11685:266-910(+)
MPSEKRQSGPLCSQHCLKIRRCTSTSAERPEQAPRSYRTRRSSPASDRKASKFEMLSSLFPHGNDCLLRSCCCCCCSCCGWCCWWHASQLEVLEAQVPGQPTHQTASFGVPRRSRRRSKRLWAASCRFCCCCWQGTQQSGPSSGWLTVCHLRTPPSSYVRECCCAHGVSSAGHLCCRGVAVVVVVVAAVGAMLSDCGHAHGRGSKELAKQRRPG